MEARTTFGLQDLLKILNDTEGEYKVENRWLYPAIQTRKVDVETISKELEEEERFRKRSLLKDNLQAEEKERLKEQERKKNKENEKTNKQYLWGIPKSLRDINDKDKLEPIEGIKTSISKPVLVRDYKTEMEEWEKRTEEEQIKIKEQVRNIEKSSSL
jgi:hypothetical protein